MVSKVALALYNSLPHQEFSHEAKDDQLAHLFLAVQRP